MATNRNLIRKLYNSGAIIHCKAHKESLELARILNSAGYTWCNDKTYIELDQWNDYKENTVYYINDGTFGHLINVRKNQLPNLIAFSKIHFGCNTIIKYLI